jgi:uroporphyrinogen-III synthase
MARLDGRTVVVTRNAGGEDALGARLRALGAAVRELPAIVIGPPASFDALDAALRALDEFDWVMFTSANAVDRTVERLAVLGVPASALARRSLAAVGLATAARLAATIRAPDVVPDEARGGALADALRARVEARRVLVPRPAEGRPELVAGLLAAGAHVTAVEAYRTVAAPPEQLAPLGAWLEAREVDAIAFASPSAVRAVVAALGARARLLERTLVAAIGPTTADALQALGLRTGVQPARYTAGDLADAIAERLGPR